MSRIKNLFEHLSRPSCSVDETSLLLHNPLVTLINNVLGLGGDSKKTCSILKEITTIPYLNKEFGILRSKSMDPVNDPYIKKFLEEVQNNLFETIWSEQKTKTSDMKEVYHNEQLYQQEIFDNLLSRMGVVDKIFISQLDNILGIAMDNNINLNFSYLYKIIKDKMLQHSLDPSISHLVDYIVDNFEYFGNDKNIRKIMNLIFANAYKYKDLAQSIYEKCPEFLDINLIQKIYYENNIKEVDILKNNLVILYLTGIQIGDSIASGKTARLFSSKKKKSNKKKSNKKKSNKKKSNKKKSKA